MNKVRATNDIDYINELINMPGVREYHSPPSNTDEIDFGPAMAAGTVAVTYNETHLWLYVPVTLGVYEVHTSVHPEHRGADTVGLSRESVDYMFTYTDAVELWTRVPEGNEAAYALAQKCGFKTRFTTHGAWDGEPVRAMSLPISVWAARATSFRRMGEWLRWELEQAGATVEEDKIADQYAGIATWMANNGQGVKATWFYNQYAFTAFRPLITCHGDNPAILQLGEYFVKWEDGEIDIKER